MKRQKRATKWGSPCLSIEMICWNSRRVLLFIAHVVCQQFYPRRIRPGVSVRSARPRAGAKGVAVGLGDARANNFCRKLWRFRRMDLALIATQQPGLGRGRYGLFRAQSSISRSISPHIVGNFVLVDIDNRLLMMLARGGRY